MRPFMTLLALLLSAVTSVTAERILTSNSLNSCQRQSLFSASLFKVTITPNNSMVTVDLSASASVEGYVVFDVSLDVYGYRFFHDKFDPCNGELKLSQMCPMTPGNIDSKFNFDLGDTLDQIPGIAYGIPDLDATIRAFINLTDTGESVACVEADFSTGKTVEQISVKWVTAIIIGLGLVSSAVTSLLGYGNAAAHLAANTLSLFSYFQAQAIVGLTGIHMPPIVEAWTQNFQWTMGIIKMDWMQDIFTWFQRATGGTPASIFHFLGSASVQVAKRSLDGLVPRSVMHHAARGLDGLIKRGNIELASGSYIVYASSSTFLTLIFATIIVVLSKFALDLCVKQAWVKRDRFLEFRTEWRTILKGILLRLIFMGFPGIVILSVWEFTQADSPALVLLAVFYFFGMLLILVSAAFTIIRLAAFKDPTYSLFGDSRVLNKWGFLYIQFRASGYYFIVPLIAYILVKGFFIALGQHNGDLQAIALVVIEAAPMITSTVMLPYMDKSTNSLNIAIYVLNFLNAICLVILTNVFGMPAMGPSVTGVILVLFNAAFSLILLLMTIISSALVFWQKNPDSRFPFMADDRASFMKSQTQVDTLTELDALAATARLDRVAMRSSDDLTPPRFPADDIPSTSSSLTSLYQLRYNIRNGIRHDHLHDFLYST
ncbi:hypothetical protein CEP52_004162 [Fusarium oligoseptatum]|uniref:ML-like domain-containing protein n=1 Tax=Fusarium oligoseptatum TaxID=2604345 RepID=A0A428U546_9HYPO|nr:hypothetical protein CEP52_004162 [Fusarium oligoseptatum]